MAAAASETPTAATPAGRIAGVDIARAIALIGMLMVHFGPSGAPGLEGALYGFAHGRASILFVVVAGVGMALLTARKEGRGAAQLRMAWFALVLMPLGLWLQTLPHPIAVILHHYAFFFLFGIAICGLPQRALLALAVGATFIGPALYLAGRMVLGLAFFNRQSVELGDGALDIILAMLVAGPYPLLTWAGPIAFGLFLGRSDLRDSQTRWTMIALGVGVALLTAPLSGLGMALFGEPASRAAWQTIFSAAPHSEMPLWLINSTAVATATLGLSLFAGDLLGRFARPMVVLGQFVLTAYVAQLFALAAWRDVLQHDTVGAATLSVLVFTTLMTIAAMLWQRFVGRRGPVEWLMHAPWDAIRNQTRPHQQAARPHGWQSGANDAKGMFPRE